MEQETTSGEGGGMDLSALLGSLQGGKGGSGPDLGSLLDSLQGGKEGGGPDLGSLLGMLGAGGQEQKGQESAGGGVDFAALLGMLGGIGGAGEEKESPPPPSPSQGLPFDPALLSTLTRAMAALREPDRNIQLLESLRPFLEEERQKKAVEAVKLLHLMRLAPLLQESGILKQLTGG